jgi:hypothetical protein
MIEPYQAIGLVPTMRGIRHRDEIQVNLDHIGHHRREVIDRQIKVMHERDIWVAPDE